MIPYRMIRSARKTLSIQITPSGEVIVRCPNRMAKREAEAFLESKRSWIEEHLEKVAARPKEPALSAQELQELSRRAAEDISERVARFAPQVGVSYGRITIRSQRTRWGSCSSKGNLNFNCLLMLTPPEILDYVVVHELCHRKEMNHSAKFWAQVERVIPDWKQRRKWLKDNGNSLISRLPG